MKRTLAIGVAVLAMAVCAPATARAQSLLEKILTTVVADRFGIDTSEILAIRKESSPSWDDLGGIVSGSYHMNAQAREVARLRKQGLGWGQIAHKMGIHPGTFNKMRNAGAFDGAKSWNGALSQRFGTKESDIEVVRRSGAKLQDVLASVVIGKIAGKSPQSVYDAYKTTKDWSRVETKFGADLDDWKKVAVAPKKPSSTGDEAPAAPGKSGGKGNGKGKGKGKGGGG